MIRHLYRHCLPLFPAAVELFDLDAADLVISSSHCAAKSAVARPGARHLCYCFTPMRYAWDQFDHYFGPERIGAGAQPSMAADPGGAWRAGMRGHRRALTAMWLFPIMLRAECPIL